MSVCLKYFQRYQSLCSGHGTEGFARERSPLLVLAGEANQRQTWGPLLANPDTLIQTIHARFTENRGILWHFGI